MMTLLVIGPLYRADDNEFRSTSDQLRYDESE